jgi:hypothetical protein
MKAFEVRLNGRKLCTAGFSERDVVLSAIVDYVSGHGNDELALTVGGLISPKGEHVRWVKDKKLRIGDEIQVKIVETESADSPRERHTRADMPTPSLRQRKQYIRDMAQKFGWTVITRRSRPSKKRK